MKIKLLYVFLFLVASYPIFPDQIIAGTDVRMEIVSIYKWNQFYNMYYAIDGSKTMEVIYEREPLDCCVKKYKPKLLIDKVDDLENEWYEGNQKYYLISHYKGIRHLKKCILFIGNQEETFIFFSKINTDFDPNAYEIIINAYKSSIKTNTKKDVSTAFFFKAAIPTTFTLLRSQGNHFIFEKEERSPENKTHISFRGLYYDREVPIEKLLISQMENTEVLIESNQHSLSRDDFKIWRVISKSKEKNTFHYRYAFLKKNKLLNFNADFSVEKAHAEFDEIEKIVASISYE